MIDPLLCASPPLLDVLLPTAWQVCLVHAGGELSVVEYGSNHALAAVRTEHMSPYLTSVSHSEVRARV